LVWEPVPPEEREDEEDEDAGWSRDLEAPVTAYLHDFVAEDAAPATPDLIQRLWEGMELLRSVVARHGIDVPAGSARCRKFDNSKRSRSACRVQ
jgi:hypothetical protein